MTQERCGTYVRHHFVIVSLVNESQTLTGQWIGRVVCSKGDVKILSVESILIVGITSTSITRWFWKRDEIHTFARAVYDGRKSIKLNIVLLFQNHWSNTTRLVESRNQPEETTRIWSEYVVNCCQLLEDQ